MSLFLDRKEITQRGYQSEFETSVWNDWHDDEEGPFRACLGVMATGGGKTITAGSLINKVLSNGGERALVLAHTRKLVKQFAGSVETHYMIPSDWEMAGKNADEDAKLISSSIQSLNGRIRKKRWKRRDFDLLIIDEAHRSLAPSYVRALNYFRAPYVLGLTATPKRGDKRDLLEFYDKLSIDISLARLIREGWLSPLKILNVPLEIDLSAIEQKAGDFDEQALGHAIAPYLRSCAKELASYTDRRSLTFLPLIELSKLFSDLCAEFGLNIKHLDGNSPEKEIELAISQLTEKKIDGICNSALLIEGVDIPCIDLVFDLTPSLSWSRYVQKAGRGTRLCPETGKEYCILLDPLWLCDDHSLLQGPADLIAQDEVEKELMEEALKNGVSDLMGAQDRAAQDRTQKLRERLEQNKGKSGRYVDALDLFLSIDDLDSAEYEAMAGWEKKPMSDGQIKMLVKAGIDLRSVRNRGHASKVIDAVISRTKAGLSTPKQAIYMRKFNHPDPWNASFDDARVFLDKRFKKRK